MFFKKKTNDKEENTPEERIKAIAFLLGSTSEELQGLVKELSLSRKSHEYQVSIYLNFQYIQQVLKNYNYMPEQIVSLAFTDDESEFNLVKIIEQQLNINDFEKDEKMRYFRLLVKCISIATEQSEAQVKDQIALSYSENGTG